MVKDSKITVKLFLQERVKPTEHNGKEYFPVYAMVIFQRKNTQFSINDFQGRPIYSTKDLFTDFNQDYENGGEVLKNWWESPWRDLLSKVLILEETVSICYERLGKNFSFKKVSQAFRAFENSVSRVAYEWAFFKWLWFTQDTLDLNDFLKEDWKNIHTSPIMMRVWSDLTTSAKEMRDFQRISIEAFVAYTSFEAFSKNKRRWTKATGGVEPPSIKGTVLSWIEGSEKEDFKSYIEKADQNLQIVDFAVRGWGLNRDFVNLFQPQKGLIDSYIAEIDGAVSRNYLESLENVVKFTSIL